MSTLKLWRHIFGRTDRTGLPFSLDRSVRRTRTGKQCNRAIPTIDLLEDRQLLTSTPYLVTNLNDSGLGSLRYAITQANGQTPNPAGSLIQFAQGLSGQITLSSTLVLSETDGPEVISGPGANLLTVSGNNAVEVFYVTGTATLSALTVSAGRSSNGGGIVNYGNLTVVNSTITNNRASSAGGGIFNGGTLGLANCTLSDNSASVGGGIYDSNGRNDYGTPLTKYGMLTLVNCTLADNSATGNGGGICNYGGAGLANCTLSDNSADYRGGIYNNGTVTLNNSIVANSLNGSDIFNQYQLSGSKNLVEDGSVLGELTGDPELGELKDNGGPTQTMALLPGSPAIDAGSNYQASHLTTDQRGAGYARISGSAVDIGAFEYQTPAPTITTLLASSGSLTYGEREVLTATVTTNPLGATTPTGGTVVFMDGSTLLGSASLSNGIATFSTTTLGAGTHAFTATYSGDGVNFSASGTQAGSPAVILPAQLTVTANSQARVYGAANAPLTYSISGFVNSDTATVVSGSPWLSTTATTTSHVSGSPYSISISAGTLWAANYSFNLVAGALSITPAPLTITVNSQTKAYGAPLPAGLVSYNGFVNGDNWPSLTSWPILSTAASASSHVNAEGYPITASGAIDPDYVISYVAGTLIITPAPLTVTADSKTEVYGAGMPVLTASYSGLVNGDTPASLAGLPMVTTTATASSHVGSYAITASDAASSDYAINYLTGTLSITPAALTITAVNEAEVYGSGLPALTASYDGLVNGDTAASLTTLPSISTTASASSHVGSYAITVSGAASSDYTISYVSGSLSVTPAALTITANNQTKVYGAALPTLTASYNGWVNGDTAASLASLPTLGTAVTAASQVGSYAITASGAASSDYAISYVTGSLIVTPATLTITADNKAKEFGSGVPALTASYNGWVNGDTAVSLASLPTLGTTASAASHVGSYVITASGAASSDYAINYVTGTLIVTPASLTITANDTAKVYGAAVPALSATYRGFVNGDSAASLTTLPTLTTAATTSSHVQTGGYAVNASGASDPDYTISYLPGTLTITPAPLIITANNASKLYGAALPALAASYTGFVNGESAASLSSRPVLATSASASSAVQPGGYAIIASGASDPDYTISYQPGTLLITPAPLTITANNASMVQGAAVPSLSVSYSGLVYGDSASGLSTPPTTATPASPLSQAGTYPIVVGGASSPNYAINYANGILVVTPAPVRVLKVSTEAVRLGKTRKTTQVIVLQFTGSLNLGTAQSIREYSLTTIPANKRQKSQVVALSQAQYNAASNTVTLITRKPLVHKPSLKLTYNLLDAYDHSVSGSATIGKKG